MRKVVPSFGVLRIQPHCMHECRARRRRLPHIEQGTSQMVERRRMVVVGLLRELAASNRAIEIAAQMAAQRLVDQARSARFRRALFDQALGGIVHALADVVLAQPVAADTIRCVLNQQGDRFVDVTTPQQQISQRQCMRVLDRVGSQLRAQECLAARIICSGFDRAVTGLGHAATCWNRSMREGCHSRPCSLRTRLDAVERSAMQVSRDDRISPARTSMSAIYEWCTLVKNVFCMGWHRVQTPCL